MCYLHNFLQSFRKCSKYHPKKKTPYSWKVVFSDGFGTFLLLGITRTRYYLKSGWANSFSIDLVFFNWKVLIGHTWVYDNLDFWPYNWKIKIFKPFSTNQNFPQFCYDMTKEKTLAHLNLSNFAIFIYTLMLRWKGNQVFSILSRLWWNFVYDHWPGLISKDDHSCLTQAPKL